LAPYFVAYFENMFCNFKRIFWLVGLHILISSGYGAITILKCSKSRKYGGLDCLPLMYFGKSFLRFNVNILACWVAYFGQL
jgi:hypothetical protein